MIYVFSNIGKFDIYSNEDVVERYFYPDYDEKNQVVDEFADFF